MFANSAVVPERLKRPITKRDMERAITRSALTAPMMIPIHKASKNNMEYGTHKFRGDSLVRVRRSNRNGKPGFVVQVKFFVKKATIVSLVAVIIGCTYVDTFFAGGLMLAAQPVEAAEIITRDQPNIVPPVLVAIGKAETHNDMYCNEDAIKMKWCKPAAKGTILVTTNTDGSVDVGGYALNNATWGADASRLGIDIYTEEGNTQMAEWILNNYGTAPWYLSRGRWNN